MDLMTLLVLVALTIVVFLLLLVAADLRAIRHELLPDIRTALLKQGHGATIRWVGPHIPESNPHVRPSQATPSLAGLFVIWRWSEGRWAPDSSRLPPGVDPGLPPAHPGAFDGDYAKTWVTGPRQ